MTKFTGTGIIQDAAEGAIVFGVLVFGLVDGLDDVWIFGGVFADDVSGVIRGGIVMDYSFKFEIRFLHDKALQTLANVRLMVVSKSFDAHHGGTSIHYL